MHVETGEVKTNCWHVAGGKLMLDIFVCCRIKKRNPEARGQPWPQTSFELSEDATFWTVEMLTAAKLNLRRICCFPAALTSVLQLLAGAHFNPVSYSSSSQLRGHCHLMRSIRFNRLIGNTMLDLAVAERGTAALCRCSHHCHFVSFIFW